MLHVVPSPICCLIWNECSWPGSLQFLGPLLIFGLILLLPLPLSLHHVFVTLLVGRSGSLLAVDLYHLLPPSEMVAQLLHLEAPSEVPAHLLRSMALLLVAPSELLAHLLRSLAPSKLAACWEQLLVPLEPGALLDEAIGGALLSPRRGGSRVCR